MPEVLEKYARHYETGEPMPKALLDKVLAARTFNAGFNTVEFTSSALVDMAYPHAADAAEDPLRFRPRCLPKLGMPHSIVMRHRTPHFQHVFSGDGYSAGYYSYMWSEVLDADAFAAFEETGDAFDPAMAAKLKDNIYSVGGSVDPEDALQGLPWQAADARCDDGKKGAGVSSLGCVDIRRDADACKGRLLRFRYSRNPIVRIVVPVRRNPGSFSTRPDLNSNDQPSVEISRPDQGAPIPPPFANAKKPVRARQMKLGAAISAPDKPPR